MPIIDESLLPYSKRLRSIAQSQVRFAFVPGVFSIMLVLGFAQCGRPRSSGRETWAEVDDSPIYRDQVETAYRARLTPGSDAGSPEQALSQKLNVLNELVDEQLLLTHASHSQIAVSEADVDKAVADRQTPYGKEEFQKKLTEQGLSEGDLRQQIRRGLIIQKLLNKEVISRLKVTDEEISAYYEHNKSTFSVPETTYHLAQIEVTPGSSGNPRGGDAASMQAAERKIAALYMRVRAGEDFANLAQQYSDDPKTRPGGGDMGFMPASNLAAPVRKVIDSLKVGQFTGVMPLGNSFHIIKLLGREEPGQHPLSDPQVQANIRRGLMSEKQELLQAAYVEDLRNRAKVVDYLARKVIATAGQVQDK